MGAYSLAGNISEYVKETSARTIFRFFTAVKINISILYFITHRNLVYGHQWLGGIN
jgi:hypothetical protein